MSDTLSLWGPEASPLGVEAASASLTGPLRPGRHLKQPCRAQKYPTAATRTTVQASGDADEKVKFQQHMQYMYEATQGRQAGMFELW